MSKPKLKPITYRTDKLIVTVSSTNLPSKEAVENTNRKINELMNKRFAS